MIQAKKTPKDGSAHPVHNEDDTRYYHTITAGASTSRSPMTKVMDIFRKPHVPPPPPPPPQEEERDRREKKRDKVNVKISYLVHPDYYTLFS